MLWQKCCFFPSQKAGCSALYYGVLEKSLCIKFFALKVFDFHFYSKILAMYHLEDKNLLKTTC